ncbi:MotA/TolQ/ExbB proton channel family protein [Undibacterium griseum]|uniref:Biopolymer transport protein ExbB n=1 Tax=Undibacterium griseum TaxID=2762295 RepID=A0ABR6YS01_9BURK|nr:MotA/TolQ/ExbB proton channel family protein [Undibacterium griseum]MBC3886695.1 MotA/TolQ/ExbB proton channel family protein [Undibacterium griseum]
MKTRFSAFLAAAILALSAPAFAEEAASAATAAPAASATAPATPAADVAAPAPAADAPAKEVIENPYGLDALWKTGDFVAKGTLIIMVIMSMGSWYILITKIIDQVKLAGQASDARSKFWKAASVNAASASLKEGSPFRFIADSGIKATEHHEGALLEQIDLNTWVSMSIQRAVEKVQSRLQDGLAFLATVGSTAPFVGLFGTVWGIYHALTAIGMSGQASIDKVAGPVGEALIMTAIGLAVAVPAVLGYNFLVRRNKSAMEEVRAFAADLHSVVLSGNMNKTANKK